MPLKVSKFQCFFMQVGVNDDGTHVAIGELIDEVFAEDIDDNEKNDDEDLNPLNFKYGLLNKLIC